MKQIGHVTTNSQYLIGIIFTSTTTTTPPLSSENGGSVNSPTIYKNIYVTAFLTVNFPSYRY